MANPYPVRVHQVRIRTRLPVPGKPPASGKLTIQDTPKYFSEELVVQAGSTENICYLSPRQALPPWKVVDSAGVVLGIDISEDRSGGFTTIWGEALK